MMMKNSIWILAFCFALSLSPTARAQELAKVPSNFDQSPWVVDTENPPLANYPRAWGEFPNPCSYANFRYDDPIQSFGKFSAAPLHVFFGNTRANANSTYESLRSTGEGTCFGGPLNRSSFYMPAMMNAAGKLILPDFIDVYYRGTVETRPFPRGLKMMFGPKFMDSSYQWNANSVRYAWSFGAPGGWWGADYQAQIFKDYPKTALPDWAFLNGAYRLLVRAVSPDCWDGVNLDSANHFSHLAYSGPDASVTAHCPATHPVKIPQVTVTAAYSWIDRTDVQAWYLSSDKDGLRNDPPGTNWYVGFIPAWDDDVMVSWTTNILNPLKYGAFSKLGDGRRLELPPTSKLNPTFVQNLQTGRSPFFIWDLTGPSLWLNGGTVPASNQRMDPPAR